MVPPVWIEPSDVASASFDSDLSGLRRSPGALARLGWPLAALLLIAGMTAIAGAASLPVGFSETQIGGSWSEAVGMEFTVDGRLFVWERGGRVWIVENGVKQSTPFIDIAEEVGGWRDFGLLGFALHPDFNNNGLFYLYYVVDRHHLMNFGTPAYSATTNEYFTATQGRITRYQALKPPGDPDYTNTTVAAIRRASS